MPNYYVSGSDLPQQIKSHFSWQRGVGGRRVDVVTGIYADMLARVGTSETEVLAATGWKAIYDEIQITPQEESPLVRAELIINDPEVEIIWEVIPTLTELSLLETSVAWPLRLIDLSAATVTQGILDMNLLEWIRFLLDNPGERAFSFANPIAQRLYELELAGMRAVPRYLPCLRLSQTVASRYDQQLAVTFVGDVLSTSALYALEDVPADVLFSFPANPVARDGFTWGWLKGAPSVRRSGRGFWSLQQDWQFGEYVSDPPGLFVFVP